ncbi:hypothetical protein [Xanthobacter flavus]|uniref:hypothetical protein n=1 Tax=Xanthobacter flavus TaxID=281 RepID=UPI003727C09C
MTEIKAPEGGRPVSEMQRRIAEEIMNTERELTGCYARRFDDLKPESRAHYLWLALAAMKAMREPTPVMEQAAEWAAEDGALLDFDRDDFRLTFTAALDAEISIAEGGKDD